MTLTNTLLRALSLAAVAALAACAGTGGDRTGTVWPAPPQTPPQGPDAPSGGDTAGTPQTTAPTAPVPVEPVQPQRPVFPRSADEISGQAVLALMDQAAQDRQDGNLDLAAANLERAVRIEPRNYFVWSSLASLYLAKGLNQQAESVARKSNSLARGNPFVEADNWQLIANSLQAQGDAAGALQAQARADELQRAIAAAPSQPNDG